MQMTDSGLLLPSGVSNYRKEDPPPFGPVAKWDSGVTQYQLPGGGIIQFDLNQLTLDDYRHMRDHYQINATMTLLTFMIHQIDWQIECEDKEIADEIESQLRPIWPQVVRGFSQAFWAGRSPMGLEFENDVRRRKVVLKRVKDLRPEISKVHWKKVNGYAPPGYVPPKHNVYDGIQQDGVRFPLPVDNTLWYPLLMENGDYTGKKLLRPAFVPWFFSNLIHMFAARYLERFGEPLPIGRADFDSSVEQGGEMVSGRKAMENILTALRSRSVVTLPSDRDPDTNEYTFDLEYLESQMRGADFERYLTRLDEEMSLGLFTPILMFRTADVGSYNLGVNHMQVWMWMLNALAGDMKHYLDKYLIERLKGFNFTPNAPTASWKYRKLGKQDNETMRAMITQMIRDKMVKPADLVEFGQAIGIDLEEIEQLMEPPASEEDDGQGPGDDPRSGEGRPEREGEQPPRVEAANAVARQISDRVRAQVVKAFRAGEINDGNFMPTPGHQRQLERALESEGVDPLVAKSRVGEFYTSLDKWVKAVQHVDFDDVLEYMTAFDHFMYKELERLT